MMSGYNRVLSLMISLLVATTAGAESVYVASEWQFGLHADKSTGSPIVKLIPSGTELELIKSEDGVSYVRTPDGTDGWIDNSYLAATLPVTPAPPDSTDTRPVAATAAEPPASSPEGRTDMATLEQQLKSERVRTGELQVQIAELRKRLGQDGSNDSLYEKIDQLAMEKKQLEVQLAQTLEGDNGPATPVSAGQAEEGLYNPGNMLIGVVIALIAGIIAGLYLMDFLYRRRHGGFRV